MVESQAWSFLITQHYIWTNTKAYNNDNMLIITVARP